MGSRANYILITSQQTSYYYHHWGAQTIPQDLFWGPENAQCFIKSLEPVDELLDDVWCEGAVLIDYPQQILMLYGGEDLQWHHTLKRVYLALLRLSWKGWRVYWAEYEWQSILQAFGHPLEGYIEPKSLAFARLRTSDLKKGLEYQDTLTTLKTDHQFLHLGMHFRCDVILAQGKKILKKLLKLPSTTIISQTCDAYYDSFLFIDMDKQSIVYQNEYNRHPELPGYLQKIWPDWEIEENLKGLYRHAQLCELDWQKLVISQEEALQVLTKLCLNNTQHDRGRVINMLNEQELTVTEVNPYYFQDTKPELTQTQKENHFYHILQQWLSIENHYEKALTVPIGH